MAELIANMIFCSTCGDKMAFNAAACPKCGAPNLTMKPVTGNKSFVVTLLLCFFLGAFGFHRFYVGKVVSGIFQLLTLGGLGVWTLIDFVMIVVGKFKDGRGLALER